VISILVIEDSERDQRLFKAMMVEGGFPWLRGVHFDFLRAPPADFRNCDVYDAVIVDLHLGAILGTDWGRELHVHNWSLPKMLLTGAHFIDLPFNVFDTFDFVATKPGTDPTSPGDCFGVMRALMRRVEARKRCEIAEQRGYQKALDDIQAGKVAGYYRTD
jgi:DNA-binding response OmpR family regulator